MAWLVATCGLVSTLQGVAWLAHPRRARRAAGVALGVVGIAMLCAGLVHGLVPGFFG
ncbi:MAG: hypothetical protein JNK45_23515 [Myxococcales bacterium]|nr:hypothetical protein [Myxococcales bacterium]